MTTLTYMSDTHTEAPSVYSPSPEFAEQANATEELYREAEQDRLAFWAKQADRLSWDTPFTEVLDWSEAPFAKWFVGGKLNVAYNCVDRHVEAGNGGQGVAILSEEAAMSCLRAVRAVLMSALMAATLPLLMPPSIRFAASSKIAPIWARFSCGAVWAVIPGANPLGTG